MLLHKILKFTFEFVRILIVEDKNVQFMFFGKVVFQIILGLKYNKTLVRYILCSEVDYYDAEEYPEDVVAFEEESPKNVSSFEEGYPTNVSNYEEGEGSFLPNISKGIVEEFMKEFMKYVTLYFLNETEMSTGFGGKDM